MGDDNADWISRKRTWGMLKALHPTTIDLERVSLIRERSPEYLSRSENLEALLLALGLNDEGMHELPPVLHPYCGSGLRTWQYPSQFSKYLIRISQLAVRSYLEIGIRHGGSFVATVEILNRFSPLEFAVAVDIIPCPSLSLYKPIHARAEFICMNTLSADFRALINRLKPIDLVFIDSHHEELQLRQEFASVRDAASMIAFHDIANRNCPGVARVWNDIKGMDAFDCVEYTDQYEGMGPYMGIGLAVRKDRLPS